MRRLRMKAAAKNIERFRADFVERVAALMRERHLEQADLARLLGVNSSYISILLSGNRSLKLDTMAKIAAALGMEIRLELVNPRPGE